jgi:hypothetical protein
MSGAECRARKVGRRAPGAGRRAPGLSLTIVSHHTI